MWCLTDGRYPVALWIFLLLFGIVDSTENILTDVKYDAWSTLSFPADSWQMKNSSDPSSVYRKRKIYYSNKAEHKWVIEGPKNSVITLEILRLETEACCDFLRVYAGDNTQKNYSGLHNVSSFLYSSGNQVDLVFKSDSRRKSAGFFLRYAANGPLKSDFTNGTGDFAASNVMGLEHRVCETKIKTKEGTSIEFQFSELQVNEDSSFTIANGESDMRTTKGSIPQQNTPFVSDTNELTLKLEGIGKYKGSYISYPTGDCTFSSSLCGWRSIDVLHAWKRSPKGHVSFKEVPGYTLRGYRALLQSPPLTSQVRHQQCVSLTYHMLGFDVYELNFYILYTGSHLFGGQRLWQKYAESNVGSVTEVIPYAVDGPYVLLLEAVRGYGPDFSFTVDEIKLQSHCAHVERERKTISCTFEEDLCAWQQSHDDHNNWQFQKEEDNWYLEASSGSITAREGEWTTVLESPFLNVSEPATLGFYYSLQGQACLTVQLLTNSTTTVLWSECSQDVYGWIPHTVFIPAVAQTNTKKLQFVARLTSVTAIAGLDQVTMGRKTQKNFSAWSCNFTDTSCEVKQGGNETAYWSLGFSIGVGAVNYRSFPQYQCGSGLLIPQAWRCDFKKDCPDGTDELGCDRCPSHMFRCWNEPRRCILESNICNGNIYLARSNEHAPWPICARRFSCSSSRYPCRRDQYLCPHYSKEKCIDSKQIWDGRRDCSDGSDERNRVEYPECLNDVKPMNETSTDNLPFYTKDHCLKAESPSTGMCVPYIVMCNQGCVGEANKQICLTSNNKGPPTFLQMKMPFKRENIVRTASLHTPEAIQQDFEYMCMSFRYLVNEVDEKQAPTLRLYMESEQGSLLLWSQTGQTSDDWLYAAVVVPYMGPMSFYLRFESQISEKAKRTNVALGELMIQRGSVHNKSPTSCTDQLLGTSKFQQSLGMWSTERHHYKFDKKSTNEKAIKPQSTSTQWLLVNSIPGMRRTGQVLTPRRSVLLEKDVIILLGVSPAVDNIPSDGYLLCNSSKTSGSTYLWSLPVPSSKGLCIKFHYYMYGQEETKLSVGIPDENGNFTSLFSLSWRLRDRWQEAVVSFNNSVLPAFTEIVFHCNTFSSTNTDVALDNIRIMKEPCGQNNVDFTIIDIVTATRVLRTDLS